MAFFSNHIPVLLGVYDNELSVSLFPSNSNGKTIGRDSLDSTHHAGGSPEQHPTLNNVFKNTNGHVFVAGSFQFEWRWDPSEATAEDINAYITLLETQVPAESTITCNLENHTLLVDLHDSNFAVPEWTGQLVQWHPKAPYGKITNTSDDAEFVCVTRLNGTYHDYNFEQKTLEPNEILVITRPQCDKCYIMFTGDVTKGDAVLTKNKLYKMTSESLEITNTGTQRIKVLRYTKGNG
jgi:hypothetical protein